MKLGANWKSVLRKAWSVRLIAVSVLLIVLDVGAVVLEAGGAMAATPAWSIGLRSLAAVFGVAAFVARFVVQAGVK